MDVVPTLGKKGDSRFLIIVSCKVPGMMSTYVEMDGLR